MKTARFDFDDLPRCLSLDVLCDRNTASRLGASAGVGLITLAPSLLEASFAAFICRIKDRSFKSLLRILLTILLQKRYDEFSNYMF